jgi:hypothetical protein
MTEGPLADNVAIFPGVTSLPGDPAITLGAAQRAKLTSVFVIGWDESGELFLSSSIAGSPELLWLLKLAEHQLMQVAIGGD